MLRQKENHSEGEDVQKCEKRKYPFQHLVNVDSLKPFCAHCTNPWVVAGFRIPEALERYLFTHVAPEL